MTADGRAEESAEFTEAFVEADGFRIRYLAAGEGDALICIHGGGGLRLSPVHGIFARERRVITFEIPGFGDSPANDRSRSLEALAATMNDAIAALGIGGYSLMGNSFGAKLALWMACLRPEPVHAIVLAAPAAIRVAGQSPSGASPGDMASMLHAHPERHTPPPPSAPGIEAKQRALIGRLIGPPRDAEFEAHLAGLETQTLALFGTADRVTPPAAAHHYREIMPNCHLVMVYDAAHAIDADRPEAVAAVAGDFLNRRDAFLVRDKSDLLYP